MIQTIIYLLIVSAFFYYDYKFNELNLGKSFWVGFISSAFFIVHLILMLGNGWDYSSLLNQRQAIEQSKSLDETAISLKKIEYNIELLSAQKQNKNFFLDPYISDRVNELDFFFE